MWRHVASNFLTVAVIGLMMLFGVIGWGRHQFEGPGPLTQAYCLKVRPGSGLSRVTNDLTAAGAIRNGYVFKVGADYAGKATALKAGSFLIEPGASMRSIVDTITQGGQSTCGTEIVYRIGVTGNDVVVREMEPATNSFVEVAKFDPAKDTAPDAFVALKDDADLRRRVLVAEGVTSWQVVEGLKTVDVMAGEVATVPAEGSLAPDSYDVEKGADRAALLAKMEAAQVFRLATAWDGREEGLPYKSPEEALVMASIIEKETGVPAERGRVASIFVNRLEKGMKLQTDPAVIYGITKGQGMLGRGLRQSELRKATPYNTYVIDALPPTPIANPGLASIEAALHPEKTDYLYFVADGTGGHAFAATLEEHNRNVAAWRKIEAERGLAGQGGVQEGD
jgi:UPF0755 protein